LIREIPFLPVQEHIVYRFGLPQTITTDQGSIFVSDEFVQFADSVGIKLLNSSPYYAQANGQAEASNKSLIKLIKRKISDYPRQWHTRLAEALWSYRMACHGSIQVPPYKLVYGHELFCHGKFESARGGQSCKIL
jgi:Integrase core domain.